MAAYHLLVTNAADDDIAAIHEWYEREQVGLGDVFIEELRRSYERILDGPLKYRELRGYIRVLLRRFPYAVYFAVEGGCIVVLTVLHVARDPKTWQRLRGGTDLEAGAQRDP